jgi:hypothetical protein
MEVITKSGAAVADEMFEKMAAEWENDTWEGHLGKISPGRPRMCDEELKTVSFRLPVSYISAIEAVAKRKGEPKSEIFREAIRRSFLAETQQSS